MDESSNQELSVIGWISDESLFFFQEDEDPESSSAVVEDLFEHDYLFAGMDYNGSLNVYPLLSNGKYYNNTVRGWGSLMAAANGCTGPMDYCLYAFEIPDEEGPRNYPEEGIYDESSIKGKGVLPSFLHKVVHFVLKEREVGNLIAVETLLLLPVTPSETKVYLPNWKFLLTPEDSREIYLPSETVFLKRVKEGDIDSFLESLYEEGLEEEERVLLVPIKKKEEPRVSILYPDKRKVSLPLNELSAYLTKEGDTFFSKILLYDFEALQESLKDSSIAFLGLSL